MFDPEPGNRIELHGREYTFEPHPRFPDLAYCSEGGKAFVYRVSDKSGALFALKVFKQLYRTPRIVDDCLRVASLAHLRGMVAAKRFVIDPVEPAAQSYEELSYAVLMPWLRGQTWYDLLAIGKPLKPAEAAGAAQSLLIILSGLEGEKATHTDIASGNVMVTTRSESADIELLDLEDIWKDGKGTSDPTLGTAGYAFRYFQPGQTTSCAEGDRFAAAVMVAEMLSSCHPDIIGDLVPEGLLSINDSTLSDSLQARITSHLSQFAPNYAPLYRRALEAQALTDCPTIAEMRAALIQLDFAAARSPLTDPYAAGRSQTQSQFQSGDGTQHTVSTTGAGGGAGIGTSGSMTGASGFFSQQGTGSSTVRTSTSTTGTSSTNTTSGTGNTGNIGTGSTNNTVTADTPRAGWPRPLITATVFVGLLGAGSIGYILRPRPPAPAPTGISVSSPQPSAMPSPPGGASPSPVPSASGTGTESPDKAEALRHSNKAKDLLNQIQQRITDVQLTPASQRTPEQADAARREIEQKATEALNVAQKAMDEDPALAVAVYQKAYALYRLARYDEARSAAVEAMHRDPNDSDIPTLLKVIDIKRRGGQ